ncbi:hypothetical protein LCGC14_0870600 [marine sediment metagenome]|uniref:Uncharacterized protein n=1 Tax=marine sediment metagenome TaxID=412755 RepID=A0A0F9P4X2_9ZZZZ
MVADTSKFLDLWDIWVNELIGDVWLFIFLGVVVISYLSIKAKFSMQLTILLNILFLIIVFVKSNLVILWVFILLGIGIIFYFFYQKNIIKG